MAERWDVWADRGFEPDLTPPSLPPPASEGPSPRADAPAAEPAELQLVRPSDESELQIESKALKRQVTRERPAYLQRRPTPAPDEVEAGASEGPLIVRSRALPGAGQGEALREREPRGVGVPPERGSAGGGLAQQAGRARELAEARKNLRPATESFVLEDREEQLEGADAVPSEDAASSGEPRIPDTPLALESSEAEPMRLSRARQRFERTPPSEARLPPLRVADELDQSAGAVVVRKSAEGSVPLMSEPSEIDLRRVSGLATPAELPEPAKVAGALVLEAEREGDSIVFRVPVPTLPAGAGELEVRVRHLDGRRQLVELVRVDPSQATAPIRVPTAWLGAGEHPVEVTIPAEPPGARRIFSYSLHVP